MGLAYLGVHTSRLDQAISHQLGLPDGVHLRLGAEAAEELYQPDVLKNFKQWLEIQNAYVFTINGFPYGNFHGQRVKEKVYQPDWTEPARLSYTITLFEILAFLLAEGSEGSVSTLPASFKEFHSGDLPEAGYQHLLTCAEKIEELSVQHGLDLHLGLEPEPLGWFETTSETLVFFEQLLKRAKDPELVRRRIGVNYDCCHLALEYEDAKEGLTALQDADIRLSKLHISSALQTSPRVPAPVPGEDHVHIVPIIPQFFLHRQADAGNQLPGALRSEIL